MKTRPSSAAPVSVSSSIAAPSRAATTFREALRDSAVAIAEGDRHLAAVASLGATPGRLGSAELLCLQATVFRTTHTLDLAGRLVDKLTQAAKTTLQSQS